MPSVSILTSTRTDTGLGDYTEEFVETVYSWGWPQQGGVLLSDGSSTESAGTSSPAVVTGVRMLGPFGAGPGAKDLIVVHDHSPAMDGEWQVDGDPIEYLSPSGWSPGFQVTVKRAG